MPLPAEEFRRRAAAIKLLVLDVDGTLTDGGIVVDDCGRETKTFSVRDGFGIRCWLNAGHRAAVLSGRFSQVVAYRCRELGIAPVIQNEPHKGPAFLKLLQEAEVTADEVCMIGDDLPDLPLLLASGIGAAVADAEPEVRAQADWISSAAGGKGAVRQLIEELLVAQGRWLDVVARYGRSVAQAAHS